MNGNGGEEEQFVSDEVEKIFAAPFGATLHFSAWAREDAAAVIKAWAF